MKHIVVYKNIFIYEKVQYASWQHIIDVYEYSKKGIENLIPKITDEHIRPERKKMKVSIAAQILSRSFARCTYFCSERQLLPKHFRDTANALYFFNDLFDSLNGDSPDVNSLRSTVTKGSRHMRFWTEALHMLKNMKFVSKENRSKIDKRNTTLKNFIHTVRGFQEIHTVLFSNGFTKFSPRSINQDPLENFFGLLRSYAHNNNRLTPRSFTNAFNSSLFINVTSSHSLNANCEADKSIVLLKNLPSLLLSAESNTSYSLIADIDNIDFSFEDNSILTNSFLVDESIKILAGEVCKMLFKNISCAICRNTLFLREQHPSLNFLAFLKKFYCTMTKLIPEVCHDRHLIDVMLSLIDVDVDNWYACIDHKNVVFTDIKNLCSTIIINRFCKNINNILSKKILTPPPAGNNIEHYAINYVIKRKNAPKKFI